MNVNHYDEYTDSKYSIRSLKAHLDEHLSSHPLASSTFHARILPAQICNDIVHTYSILGYLVTYNLGKGTVFTFVKPGYLI